MEFTNNQYKENIIHKINNRPFSLHYTQVQSDNSLVLYQHWHDEIEIFYLEEGEIEFFIENKNFTIKKGEAILIPPNLLHMANNSINEECRFFAFVFNPILFSEAYTNAAYLRYIQPLKHNGLLYCTKFVPEIEWQQDILVLLKKIFMFYQRQDIGFWELELHGLLYQLWNMYYVNHMIFIRLSNSYVKLYNKLKQSITHIHQNYSSDLTLQQLAEQSGLCIGTFCRYFKELTGLTPFTYLIRFRLRKSCEALLNTELKITQIAFLCGFNNISHFNREFLLHVKCKPSDYRKQNYVPHVENDF